MMTLLITTRTAARLTQSMATVKAACATAMAAVAGRGETYHSLSALDDRTLQDIGLNRSMLISVAMHGSRSPHDGRPRCLRCE